MSEPFFIREDFSFLGGFISLQQRLADEANIKIQPMLDELEVLKRKWHPRPESVIYFEDAVIEARKVIAELIGSYSVDWPYSEDASGFEKNFAVKQAQDWFAKYGEKK